MSNNTARRLLSFLIVALMVLSGVVVLAGATARAAPVSVAQADRSSQGPSPETTAGATTSTDKIGQPPSLALWKIDSALQSVALSGDKGWSYVEIRSVAGIELTNFPSYLEHGSLAARQDYGVTGSGASIAIVDTPVDFGQANLVGQWAVNQNASSPYFGWPIVGDTGSLSDNLALWTTSSDLDRFPYPLLSSRGTFNSNFLSDTHYQAAVNATGYLHYANGVGGYTARADPPCV